jgi:hypothetical protein
MGGSAHGSINHGLLACTDARTGKCGKMRRPVKKSSIVNRPGSAIPFRFSRIGLPVAPRPCDAAL